MPRPKLYLFIGFPGSGKTTVAKLIAECSGAVHLWADHERQAMFDTVTHSKSESDELYTKLNDRTAELLQAGHSVVFDTNFNFRKDREYLQSIADAASAEMVIIWVQTPKSVARERALHPDQRDRNNYDDVMTEAEFERLTSRVEPPVGNEKFISIDGSDIDIDDVKRQLSL